MRCHGGCGICAFLTARLAAVAVAFAPVAAVSVAGAAFTALFAFRAGCAVGCCCFLAIDRFGSHGNLWRQGRLRCHGMEAAVRSFFVAWCTAVAALATFAAAVTPLAAFTAPGGRLNIGVPPIVAVCIHCAKRFCVMSGKVADTAVGYQ